MTACRQTTSSDSGLFWLPPPRARAWCSRRRRPSTSRASAGPWVIFVFRALVALYITLIFAWAVAHLRPGAQRVQSRRSTAWSRTKSIGGNLADAIFSELGLSAFEDSGAPTSRPSLPFRSDGLALNTVLGGLSWCGFQEVATACLNMRKDF